MKNTKKKVLVGALVVSLAALVSVGSIAWFSASDSVQNKFMVATSDDPDDPDKDFDVDVWENTPTGKVNPEDPETPYVYPDVMPGDTLKKETYVENTGNYEEYIRMIVTVSDADAWAALLSTEDTTVAPADVKLTDIVTGLNETGFGLDEDFTPVYDADAKTLTYVFYGNGVLPAGEKAKLFDAVKIPGSMTKEQADQFTVKGSDKQGSFTIDVKAQAVQTAHLGEGNTVFEKAKSAFTTVGMNITD